MIDLISRQDAIEAINRLAEMVNEGMGWDAIHRNDAVIVLKSLPSTERKKGEWIKGLNIGLYICSECKYVEDGKPNYCAGCGADMRGEEYYD